MGHSSNRVIAVSSWVVLAALGSVAGAAPVVKPFSQILTRPAADPGGSNYTAVLDLNEDGINDVSIAHTTMLETGQTLPHSINVISGINGASILASVGTVVALHPGDLAGPGGAYSTSLLHMIDTIPNGIVTGNGTFFQPAVAVGVQIPVGGQSRFAWLGVQLQFPVPANPLSDLLVLHDYGYETTANTAVAAQAPEPAALGLVALAAAAPLLTRRRRRTA